MNIGVDIDDTIVITTECIIKYADIFNKEVLGKEKNINEMGKIKDRFYLNNLYGWSDELKKQFFQKYYKNILLECKVMKDVSKVLNRLKEEGDKIIFITARMTYIKNCETYEITKNMLNENNIPYDLIVMDAREKLNYAKENNIDIFIEDSFETCKTLEETGIKSLLMTSVMNENIDTYEIERVHSWEEVYNKICKLKKGEK